MILPEDFRPPPETRRVLGRWRSTAATGFEDRIGSGGTGEAWRAVDERLNRVVAIKLLHPWVAQAEVGRERFRREAAAMAGCGTRTSSSVLEFNYTAERPFLVQEYCPGGILSALLGGGPLPWIASARWRSRSPRRSRTRTRTASSTAT